MWRLLAPTRSVSLRTKILGIALVGGVLPLALVGVWLAENTQRVGEQLLRDRIDTTLNRVSQEVGARWISHRSALVDIAHDTIVQRLLLEPRSTSPGATRPIPLRSMTGSFADLRAATALILVRDQSDSARWILASDAMGSPVLAPAADSLRVTTGLSTDVIPISLPIVARRRQRNGASVTLGVVEARFRTAAIVPVVNAGVAAGGAVVAVVDRRTRTIVAPLPFDATLLRESRFMWGGEEWLSASRALEDPYIEILAAAPLTGFTLPFQRAARTGVAALLGVAAVAFLVVTLLTRRVTHSLVELADAADAVSKGDLDRQVPRRTRDEVGRLANAFNLMTESLKRTLAELSQRQAVAAVGEFASALAHEIRNPLSAIRLNLQHLEEALESDAKLRTPVKHSLRDIDRLENTVAGALRLARTGRMHMETLSLSVLLEAAARSAAPEFQRRAVTLVMPGDAIAGVDVRGNAAALEQVFLNLLLNAADAACAAGAGGRVEVRVAQDAARTTVTIWDSGSGFAPEARERAFEAFFTTKAEGSGLGLTVARRVAIAHGGSLEIGEKTVSGAERGEGAGTSVHVHLPRLSGVAAAHPVARRGNAAVHGA